MSVTEKTEVTVEKLTTRDYYFTSGCGSGKEQLYLDAKMNCQYGSNRLPNAEK
jgi:hypothetical protein